MSILVWALRILVFAVFFGFALLNMAPASLDYLFGQWNAPLALILMVFFAAGTALGVLVSVPAIMRHKREARRLRQLQVPPTSAPAEPPRLG